MLKRNSIFMKILLNNLIITLIPLVLIMSVICYLFCASYTDKEKRAVSNRANEYSRSIKKELVDAIQKGDYILKNTYIVNNLDRTFYNTLDRLEFNNNLTLYLDNIANTGYTGSLMIYFTNNTLFESKYMSKITRIDNIAEIKKYFKDNNTNVYWDNTIHTDENNKDYFLCYRDMLLNDGSILTCRAYIPKPPDRNYNVYIAAYDEKFSNDQRYITSDINKSYLVVSELNRSNMSGTYLNYILLFFGITICFIITIVFLTSKITKKITYDIDNFITQLDENDILSSDIQFTSKQEESGELAVIKKALNNLIMKVKVISDAQYEKELEMRKLELSLLQSKLDPHILYNSLSVIKLKAFKHNDNDTIGVIDNLVRYYRSILSRGKEFVSIEDELNMIENYVLVNEISHNKKYNLQIVIAEELKPKPILHLLLQPFVENAIIHGLGGSQKDCIIKITCTYEDSILTFTIWDNGYGLTPEKLSILNNLEAYENSYGIKNTYQRMKLMYGSESDITFESVKGKYTQATIRLQDSTIKLSRSDPLYSAAP